MIFARRNALPNHVKVNKSGSISVLSFVRHLGLADDVEFDVVIEHQEGQVKLVLTTDRPNSFNKE